MIATYVCLLKRNIFYNPSLIFSDELQDCSSFQKLISDQFRHLKLISDQFSFLNVNLEDHTRFNSPKIQDHLSRTGIYNAGIGLLVHRAYVYCFTDVEYLPAFNYLFPDSLRSIFFWETSSSQLLIVLLLEPYLLCNLNYYFSSLILTPSSSSLSLSSLELLVSLLGDINT